MMCPCTQVRNLFARPLISSSAQIKFQVDQPVQGSVFVHTKGRPRESKQNDICGVRFQLLHVRFCCNLEKLNQFQVSQILSHFECW